MKKFGLILVAVLLGLVLIGCATTSETSDVPPALTEFVTIMRDDAIAGRWNPATTFPNNHGINIGVRGDNPNKNISKFVITLKQNGTVITTREVEIAITANSFTQFIGSFPISTAGDYTGEVYAVDRRGNQSNTRTTTFTVNP